MENFRQVAPTEIVTLVDQFGNELPNQEREEFYRLLDESFSNVSADLKAEDSDWMSARLTVKDRSSRYWKDIINESRTYARHDGHCRQMIRLYVDFAIGTGFTWRTKKTRYDNTLSKYWFSKDNRNIFSIAGQRKTARTLLVDGEVYFYHFGEGEDTVTRRGDSTQISDLIVDPEDESRVLGYLRIYTTKSGVSTTLAYRDWLNHEKLEGVLKGSSGTISTKSSDIPDYEDNVVVQRIVFDENESGFGSPLLQTSIVWARSHRHFMRCRAAVMHSIAKFVRKVKTKGSQSTINNFISAFNNTTTGAHNPGYSPGSTWVENMGLDMQAMPQETGADAAKIDGSMLMQVLGVGAGIFPHYLGSGESFRLATAGAMEPPMVKAFEAFQKLILDEYYYLFEYILDKDDVQKAVSIDVPIVQTRDIPAFLHAVNETANSFPKMKQSEDVLQFVLTQLGFKDVQQVVERIQRIPKPAPAELMRDPVNGPNGDIPIGNSQKTGLPSERPRID